ncbi:MAG: adenine phosphoribosyltransferase [Oscillospiraceae bacterium]|jgi:adenine phosphoribosyltransferase|nr:adenine phosphoribosyltransferase [Oscillospiraceae bacterium]
MDYTLHAAGLTRRLPLCGISDDLYIAAFVIFGDVELTRACAEHLLGILPPGTDLLITAEAKGIPLVYEMARVSGLPYLVARKAAKLYMKDVCSVEVRSITTAARQTLYIDRDDAEAMRGKGVTLVDDVISTGESLRALEKLVITAGGTVAGRLAVLAEGDAHLRQDIRYLERLPLFNAKGEEL